MSCASHTQVVYPLLIIFSWLYFIWIISLVWSGVPAGDTVDSTLSTWRNPAEIHCPPGGVWSEWVTTDPCPSTCGACHVARRKRTCTTLCGECPCKGPCGQSLCPFPALTTGTCCKPHKKSINHQTGCFFCGTDIIPALQCAHKR